MLAMMSLFAEESCDPLDTIKNGMSRIRGPAWVTVEWDWGDDHTFTMNVFIGAYGDSMITDAGCLYQPLGPPRADDLDQYGEFLLMLCSRRDCSQTVTSLAQSCARHIGLPWTMLLRLPTDIPAREGAVVQWPEGSAWTKCGGDGSSFIGGDAHEC